MAGFESHNGRKVVRPVRLTQCKICLGGILATDARVWVRCTIATLTETKKIVGLVHQPCADQNKIQYVGKPSTGGTTQANKQIH